uniref:Uncharacterized protein n=1 Tax=Cacopsylla melanoneura TaxID=428564 RepID=A0A8D9DYZ8_9HEMI
MKSPRKKLRKSLLRLSKQVLVISPQEILSAEEIVETYLLTELFTAAMTKTKSVQAIIRSIRQAEENESVGHFERHSEVLIETTKTTATITGMKGKMSIMRSAMRMEEPMEKGTKESEDTQIQGRISVGPIVAVKWPATDTAVK